jgi:hypothetical protein
MVQAIRFFFVLAGSWRSALPLPVFLSRPKAGGKCAVFPAGC